MSDAADARSVFQPEQCGFLHSLLFDCGCREQLMHNYLTFPSTSQLCLVGVSSNLFEHERVRQVVVDIFVSGFISCLGAFMSFLIKFPVPDAADAHGRVSFILVS